MLPPPKPKLSPPKPQSAFSPVGKKQALAVFQPSAAPPPRRDEPPLAIMAKFAQKSAPAPTQTPYNAAAKHMPVARGKEALAQAPLASTPMAQESPRLKPTSPPQRSVAHSTSPPPISPLAQNPMPADDVHANHMSALHIAKAHNDRRAKQDDIRRFKAEREALAREEERSSERKGVLAELEECYVHNVSLAEEAMMRRLRIEEVDAHVRIAREEKASRERVAAARAQMMKEVAVREKAVQKQEDALDRRRTAVHG